MSLMMNFHRKQKLFLKIMHLKENEIIILYL